MKAAVFAAILSGCLAISCAGHNRACVKRLNDLDTKLEKIQREVTILKNKGKPIVFKITPTKDN